MGLVPYDTDDSSSDDTSAHNVASTSSSRENTSRPPAVRHTQKRKALPGLPEDYTSNDPRDDPALHQGRKRTRPFVDGDYDAHVYIEWISKKVYQALDRIVQRIRQLCPGLTWVSLLDPPKDPTTPRHLHISLTHPLPLRRSQIEPFATDLALGASKRTSKGSFQLCFAGELKVYYNGVKTGGQGTGGRAFLAFQVGAGHAEINGLVEHILHPLLQKLHLPLYHSNAEYHASFAWSLIDTDQAVSTEGETPTRDATESSIPDDVIKQLDDELRDRFLQSQPSGWTITELKLKIGKEIRSISL